jgi:sterol 24-C-methyltransferase
MSCFVCTVVHKNVETFLSGHGVSSSNSETAARVAVGGLLTVSAYGAMKLVNKAFGTDPIGRTREIFGKFSVQEKSRKINVDSVIDGYNKLHEDNLDDRNTAYTTLVNSYYELATLFYEWGWGQSFHFAYQLKGEGFQEAICRHEYFLAGKLGCKQGDKMLDVGCGVGGPMRNIARFTRCNVTGITLNDYQVLRGNELNDAAGLLRPGLAKSVQANFMKIPFEDNSYDGVYAIEATCHAPHREDVYGEIFRVLKPGQTFATYEWCLTPKYDSNSEEHRLIKKKIEEGDGLPDMATEAECVQALKNVGFEVVEARDMALDSLFGTGDPWWLPLHPSHNPLNFRFQLSPAGKWITRTLLWVFEGIW